MLFVSKLIAFTMLSASVSPASAAPTFEVEAICRTAIASIMGRDPKLMQVTLTTGDILFRIIDNHRDGSSTKQSFDRDTIPVARSF